MYGPQEDSEKLQFLAEIKNLRQNLLPQWIIMGDFNLILRAANKNNHRVNRRMMGRFRATVDELDLKEIKLHGRRFTWSK